MHEEHRGCHDDWETLKVVFGFAGFTFSTRNTGERGMKNIQIVMAAGKDQKSSLVFQVIPREIYEEHPCCHDDWETLKVVLCVSGITFSTRNTGERGMKNIQIVMAAGKDQKSSLVFQALPSRREKHEGHPGCYDD
jgi:hypothetical protein